MKKNFLLIVGLLFFSFGYAQKTSQYVKIDNGKGNILGYSKDSGVRILTVDGLKFKDLNKNGKLDKYEDWRLSDDVRAKDLAKRMNVNQIAGLMLYSRHQAIPAPAAGFQSGTYGGKTFEESGVEDWEMTDLQKTFLKVDNVRHVLINTVKNPDVAARWNNKIQAYVEACPLGIPINSSSDPRHSVGVSGDRKTEFNSGGDGGVSLWPDGLAMAATFDTSIVKQFGEIASQEYRALGIGTTLSPQIDLGTEPRWFRIQMTFSESVKLTTDMARAYIDGFQTSTGKDEISNGWGYKSVNAMVKHWPGGGAVEGGRDAHWAFGKFAVFPGNNLESHTRPFVDGAFKLDGATKFASAVMPYYTVTYNQATDGTNYANGFSKYLVTDLLREKYGYEGVVCTDWLITADEGRNPQEFMGKPWGVEKLTVAERHYLALMAGVDQYGGNNDMKPVIEAYKMGVKEHGKKYMKNRFEQSAVRLLKNIFRLGLFENPYLDPEESSRIVGNKEFVQAGYDAQVKSIVMLKNKANALPVKEKKTVYIPKNYIPSIRNWWGQWTMPGYGYNVDIDLVKQYYNVTEDPNKADFALVYVTSPYVNIDGGGYDIRDRKKGGNGYVPITLQYLSYTAVDAREQSIAAGDPVVDPTIKNRSYKGKTTTASNTMDLSTIITTKGQMGDKPVIVVANVARPMIFNEFESLVDGIVVYFGVSEQATLDIISGKNEPSGLLPVQMPANMKTVEKQLEDVPFDMECHKDTEGNVYDFAYGLNWSGVIKDSRTEKYKTNRF